TSVGGGGLPPGTHSYEGCQAHSDHDVPGTRSVQALLVTLPAFTQRVHTRSRFGAPGATARTETRFGSHRRFVTLWAWLIRWPTAGRFPQMSQRWAMGTLLSSCSGRTSFIA